jgi:hypothetical protein
MIPALCPGRIPRGRGDPDLATILATDPEIFFCLGRLGLRYASPQDGSRLEWLIDISGHERHGHQPTEDYRPVVLVSGSNTRAALYVDTPSLRADMPFPYDWLAGSPGAATWIGAWTREPGGTSVQYAVYSRGTSQNNAGCFYKVATQNVWYYTYTDSGGYARYSTAVANPQMHSARFDGSQSTNATRFRTWFDGVEQTNTYSKTVPAYLGSVQYMAFGVPSPADISVGIYLYIGWRRALTIDELDRCHAACKRLVTSLP